MMKKGISLLILLGILSCDPIKYETAVFPEEAVNLSVVNIQSNDYNSDLKVVFNEVQIIFSSDRNSFSSLSSHYDLVAAQIVFSWDKETGVLSVSKNSEEFDTKAEKLAQFAEKTLSSSNEREPYSFYVSESEQILLFSRDLDEEANEMYSEFLWVELY